MIRIVWIGGGSRPKVSVGTPSNVLLLNVVMKVMIATAAELIMEENLI